MRDYIIMTDSCCSLNQQEVDELGITVLPLSFTMEGKTYLDTPDHADMSPETFFQKIADGVDCIIPVATTAAQLMALQEAGVTALTAANANGTLTVYALGAAPAADLTLQITITATGQ